MQDGAEQARIGIVSFAVRRAAALVFFAASAASAQAAPPASSTTAPVATAPSAPVVPPAALHATRDDDEDDEDERGPPRRWYGWQTLTTDGASLLVVYLGAQGRTIDWNVVAAGMAGYTIGTPIVHWGHGHFGKGVASLAMRSAPWLAALALRYDRCTGCDPNATTFGFVFLEMLLVPVPVVIDAAVIAREDAPRPSFAWSPGVVVWKDRAVIGVDGTF